MIEFLSSTSGSIFIKNLFILTLIIFLFLGGIAAFLSIIKDELETTISNIIYRVKQKQLHTRLRGGNEKNT